MKRILAVLALAALCLAAAPVDAQSAHPRVAFETNKGRFVVELDPEKAPETVANFLAYVDSGFYAGTIFHRVIKTFMIQGGGFTVDLVKKATREPVVNEAKNGLGNARGTIAMARTRDPHSATAQFFVNTVDNAALDYPSGDGWGYAVFGRVIEGLDTIDAIADVDTGVAQGMRDVPREPVLIESAARVE